MADSDRRTPEVARLMEERTHRADLWEAGADERERLADERERLADERDRLADEREWLADRHDHALGRREVENRARTPTSIHSVEEAAAPAAVQRAEARLRRAEAELRSARQAAARLAAGAARGAAAAERAAAAAQVEQSLYADQHAWLADRRDFIAAHRDQVAELRDGAADERDETAAVREGLADIRERELLDRERELEPSRRPGRAGSTNWAPTRQDRARHVEQRTSAERQRERAAASRRAAAQDRSRTAALWGPQAYGPELVASFARLAQQLFRSEEYTDVVPEVLKFAVDAVAGCDHASVTLYRHDHVVDTVTSDPVAAELDEIQFGCRLGPAPEAMHSDHPVYAPRLHGSRRWPVLAAAAAQLGVASCLSFGLFIAQPAQWLPLGTFTLYSAVPEAFSDEDQEFGSILAAYLAVATAMSYRRDEVDRHEAALHRALSTRDVIGQAKGILMERQRLSPGEAFDLLVRASQRLNSKLAHLAQQLADTGEFPVASDG